MAALSLLRLTQGTSFLCVSKVPHNVPGRNISKKKLLDQLNLPVQPKRPPTTFVLFFQEVKNDLKKKEDSVLNGEDLLKKAASLWRNLSPDQKGQYQNKFKALKEKYSEEMEKFQAKLTPQQRKQLASFSVHYQNVKEMQASTLMRREKEKELNKPKHPTPPFVKFVQDVKPDGSPLKEVWKGAKEKWEQLPDRAKEQYRSRFREELEQYKKQLEIWEEEMIQKGHTDVVRAKTLKAKMVSHDS